MCGDDSTHGSKAGAVLRGCLKRPVFLRKTYISGSVCQREIKAFRLLSDLFKQSLKLLKQPLKLLKQPLTVSSVAMIYICIIRLMVSRKAISQRRLSPFIYTLYRQ